MSTIGMMDGAFFVGRKEIMDWVNNTLDLNLSKVEDTASGAVACQLLDIMYPGKVPMHKVNWSANKDFEYVANYKILQTCFTKLGIERHVDVDRLISGRYMDNLEFMQWYKRFFEMTVSDKGDYDAYAQRCKGKGGAQYNGGKKTAGASKPASAGAGAAAGSKMAPGAARGVKAKPSASAAASSTTASAAATSGQENSAPNVSIGKGANVATVMQEMNELKNELQKKTETVDQLSLEMEGLERERDFYFEKLRDIEVMLQEVEDRGDGNEMTAAIFKILYATAEGFEPATDAPVTTGSKMSTAAASITTAGEAYEESY